MTCTLAAMAVLSCGLRETCAQITLLPRVDSLAGDFFGTSVDIHGDRVLIGATGIDTCGANSGAAYIYRRVDGSDDWSQEAVLQPDDCEAGAFFGRSVAIGDRFAAVAASREFFSEEMPNAVYVFEKIGEEWSQMARLTGGPAATEGSFATSVAMDEGRILVTSSGDPSGQRVDGAAYLFAFDSNTRQWVRRQRLAGDGNTQNGVFGTSGALDQDVAAVTASTYFRNRPGSVFLFESSGNGGWSQVARFGSIDDFFISVAVDSGRVLVGESKARANNSGSATLLERDEQGRWQIAQVLRPRQPYDAGAFGSGVAIDGDYALVVGFDEQLGLDINIDRVVFVFKRDSAANRWQQYHVIDVGEVAFGADVAMEGGYAVIGSASEQRPGAAYVVRLPN